MYLTEQEIAQIRIDYLTLFESPESVPITVRFSTFETGGTSFDEIYGNLTGTARQTLIEVKNIRSIVNYVSIRHLKLLEFDFIEVGDVVIYFPETFDLNEPIPGVSIIDGTMHYVLPGNMNVIPDLEHVGDLSKSLVFWIDNHRLGSAVSCKIKRT